MRISEGIPCSRLQVWSIINAHVQHIEHIFLFSIIVTLSITGDGTTNGSSGVQVYNVAIFLGYDKMSNYYRDT